MNQHVSRTLRPTILASSVVAALSLMAQQAQAQDQAQAQAQEAPKMARVEITGSSIKRIDSETALPVQLISREDIEKMGATTAAELVRNISANTAPLTDGPSISDGTSGQRGLNGANMRGLGVSSTLVLLNGRRLANFASPGDNTGVDLNNIPAGAIQRVEVLKDGASAIYGTDAIGGVINFITRKDYTGIDVAGSVAGTQQGGAGKRTLSLSAGHGDLQTDRFNVFGVLDVQQLDRMRSGQRDFIAKRPLATTLPAQMSGNTFPANFDINADQRAALIAAGLLPAGSDVGRVNPSAPKCNPPANVYAPQGPGGVAGCSYDYMEDTEIYPESRKLSFIGRATFQLNPDNQLFAEWVQTQAKTKYVLSANPVSTLRNLPVSILPEAYRNALTGPDLPDTFRRLRYRAAESGNRSNEVTSTGQRLLLGATGTIKGWDYDVALGRAENKTVDKYVDGYFLYDQFEAGVRSGLINPFGPSSQAGRDLINSIRVNDEARNAKGVSTSLDGKMSRPLMTLAGGDLALAIGGELRHEHLTFRPSDLLRTNNIQGDRSSDIPAGEQLESEEADNSRRVASVFTEVIAPFTKELEMQFALRYDHYSEVGNTTNPKIGLRWQPTTSLLLRASAGTGFRAPSLSDLRRPTIFGSAAGFLTDPVCVQGGGRIDDCTDQWPVERRSNPDLKPEKSRQFTLGVVFEPIKRTSLSIDYWNIEKRNVISTLGEQVIIENPALYDKYIQRDEDGAITNILLVKENQGKLRTSGFDIGAEWRGDRGPWGRFGVNLSGTLITHYDRQFGPEEPFRSNLGVFLNDQVIQKWRHRVNFEWDNGPFALTLANQYSTGYTDQNTTYDPFTNTLLTPNRVKYYSLWDLTGSWTVSKQLKVRAGVLNMFNTDPPFSNQAYYFLAGYDPSYTDPRGRSAFVSVNYSFR